MCKHSKVILNKYTMKWVRVDCGKCPTCMQKKAMSRATRIRNNMQSGEIALFVTLTYANKYVPYIKKSDLVCLLDAPISVVRNEDNLFELPVYKDCKCYYTRSGRLVEDCNSYVCDYKYFTESEYKILSKLHRDGKLKLYHGNGMSKDKVTVHCYSDIQKFLKRVRINLKRHFDYVKPFTYFSCLEYGSTTHRTHSHLLLFIPKEAESIFRAVISESWPYEIRSLLAKGIEVARDAATYVASYTNSISSFHPFYSASDFRNKHHYSLDLGVRSDCFQLSSVLEKVRRGNLFYNVTKVTNSGVVQFNPVIPKYVLNRHFPKFKGYSRLSSSEVAFILQCPERLRGFAQLLGYEQNKPFCRHRGVFSELRIRNGDEVGATITRLENAYKRYRDVTGASRFDFAIDYQRVWDCFNSTVLKCSYFDELGFPIVDFRNHYEDIPNNVQLPVWAPTLKDIPYEDFEQNSNNTRCRNRDEHVYLPLFHKMNKERKVTNFAMANFLGFNV